MWRIPLLFAAVVLAASCGGETERSLGGTELYQLHNCGTCHGAAGEGRSLGPPLTGLRAHWKREDLAAFLLDPPSAIAADPRLQAISRSFPSRMLSYRNTTEDERLRLADFLLGLADESQ
jgi:hypothetical protein